MMMTVFLFLIFNFPTLYYLLFIHQSISSNPPSTFSILYLDGTLLISLQDNDISLRRRLNYLVHFISFISKSSFTSSKSCITFTFASCSQNPSKIHPKSFPNPPKSLQHRVQKRYWIPNMFQNRPERDFFRFFAILGRF